MLDNTRMNSSDLIRKSIEKKIELFKKSLKEARLAQQNAPSANESHSDTTRSEMEKMVTALEINIQRQKNYLKLIPLDSRPSNGKVGLWQYAKLNNGGEPMEIIVVPDGMGGDMVDGVRLVSEITPMVVAILGKRATESADFNGRKVILLEVA